MTAQTRIKHGACALLFAAVVMNSGCSTVQVGRDFDLNAFDQQVQRGTTTQDQIQALLGRPTGTGVAVESNGERFTEWTYYFASGRLPNMPDAKVKYLQVRFDQQGVVQAYSWSGEK